MNVQRDLKILLVEFRVKVTIYVLDGIYSFPLWNETPRRTLDISTYTPKSPPRKPLSPRKRMKRDDENTQKVNY